jgi:ribose transport system ATP-binding protein
MGRDIIVMKNVFKKFGNQVILDNVNLTIKKGEVCCILGENGAGKSTLMKIISGMYIQDHGDMLFEGNQITNYSPETAQKMGIRMIYQECQLIPTLTVAQNIFLKNEIKYNSTPIINQRLMNKISADILETLQCNIDVKSYVYDLGYAQRQLVEIARALILNAKVIILDEPTSALLESEVQNLFKIISKLKSMDVAIVYISHRLEEARQIADKIVIMRDGAIIDINQQHRNLTSSYFIEKMAGSDFINRYPRVRASKGDIALRVENLSNQKRTVKDVSFYIKAGEIVGLAGLQGSGKTSIAEMIYGIEKKASGKIFINETEVKIQQPWHAKEYGITYLSEYITDNIFMLQNTSYNFTLPSLKRFKKFIFLKKKTIDKTTREQLAKLYLKIPFLRSSVGNLSQGTLQKLAIAKTIYSGGNFIIMDEPSKDLDIPSRVALYNIMNQLTKNGVSIILISSDIQELTGMCDRIYIMFNGSIVKELNSSEATSAKILHYASGEINPD